MGPIWGQQDPGGSHVGPMNLVIWVVGVSYLHGRFIVAWSNLLLYGSCISIIVIAHRTTLIDLPYLPYEI